MEWINIEDSQPPLVGVYYLVSDGKLWDMGMPTDMDEYGTLLWELVHYEFEVKFWGMPKLPEEIIYL